MMRAGESNRGIQRQGVRVKRQAVKTVFLQSREKNLTPLPFLNFLRSILPKKETTPAIFYP